MISDVLALVLPQICLYFRLYHLDKSEIIDGVIFGRRHHPDGAAPGQPTPRNATAQYPERRIDKPAIVAGLAPQLARANDAQKRRTLSDMS
jgi:hypothetical protein